MFGLLFGDPDLDSVFLSAGLLALGAGFALESVRTRDRLNVALLIVCASAFVSTVCGLVSPTTVATYTLLVAQIGGVVVFFFFFRHWLDSLPSHP